uniref:LITAF domain-containing protein n=1 Tax=Strongyloides venezuelensis TaxID=75913 RepID=A0A0K0FHS8_STRVS
MPAVNYGELCSRHGYYSTSMAPPTTTVGVSGAFKKEMAAWTMKWAKASKKEPCPHCGSVVFGEENDAPGAPPSPPSSPPPTLIISKEV